MHFHNLAGCRQTFWSGQSSYFRHRQLIKAWLCWYQAHMVWEVQCDVHLLQVRQWGSSALQEGYSCTNPTIICARQQTYSTRATYCFPWFCLSRASTTRLAELTGCGACVILVGNLYWSVCVPSQMCWNCVQLIVKALPKKAWKIRWVRGFLLQKVGRYPVSYRRINGGAWGTGSPQRDLACTLLSFSGSGSSLYSVKLTVRSSGPGQHLYKMLIGSVFGCLYITNSSWSWRTSAELVHFPASMFSIPLVYRNIPLDVPWHKVLFSLLCMRFGAELMNCCYSSDRSSYP